MGKGKVYLIGAGPGDYGLMTLKGQEYIRKSEVILYDRLANSKILEEAREDAEIIYVGKAPDNHALSQEEINSLLIKKALEGKKVARIKGGDPFLFGRGGEEALALVEHGISFEIVPGVTSAIAVPAYGGIPVTHRNVSSSLHIITGHEDPGKYESSIDYEVLGKLKGTLIFLMGIKNLKEICQNLIRYGQPENRAVAVIMKGTTVNQKVVKGTLLDISDRVEEQRITNPAIIVVGDVVNLKEELSWFENRPLFGKRVLVTRSRQQASSLSKKIEALGGEAIEFPTIQIDEPKNTDDIESILKTVGKYQWIIFTSVNGVNAFFKYMRQMTLDIRTLNGIKLCAIGPATATVLENRGLFVEYVPQEYRAEAIIEGLKGKISKGDRVLLPRADIAREILKTALVEMGAHVDNIDIYQTTIPKSNREKLIDTIKNHSVDIVTFTSSSTVNNFFHILGEENANILKDIKLAVIGPITEASLNQFGFDAKIRANEYTIDGLVTAIIEHFSS